MMAILADVGNTAGGTSCPGQSGQWGMMGPWMMGGFQTGSGWFLLGGLLWLVSWALLIFVLVAFARWLWKKGNK